MTMMKEFFEAYQNRECIRQNYDLRDHSKKVYLEENDEISDEELYDIFDQINKIPFSKKIYEKIIRKICYRNDLKHIDYIVNNFDKIRNVKGIKGRGENRICVLVLCLNFIYCNLNNEIMTIYELKNQIKKNIQKKKVYCKYLAKIIFAICCKLDIINFVKYDILSYIEKYIIIIIHKLKKLNDKTNNTLSLQVQKRVNIFDDLFEFINNATDDDEEEDKDNSSFRLDEKHFCNNFNGREIAEEENGERIFQWNDEHKGGNVTAGGVETNDNCHRGELFTICATRNSLNGDKSVNDEYFGYEAQGEEGHHSNYSAEQALAERDNEKFTVGNTIIGINLQNGKDQWSGFHCDTLNAINPSKSNGRNKKDISRNCKKRRNLKSKAEAADLDPKMLIDYLEKNVTLLSQYSCILYSFYVMWKGKDDMDTNLYDMESRRNGENLHYFVCCSIIITFNVFNIKIKEKYICHYLNVTPHVIISQKKKMNTFFLITLNEFLGFHLKKCKNIFFCIRVIFSNYILLQMYLFNIIKRYKLMEKKGFMSIINQLQIYIASFFRSIHKQFLNLSDIIIEHNFLFRSECVYKDTREIISQNYDFVHFRKLIKNIMKNHLTEKEKESFHEHYFNENYDIDLENIYLYAPKMLSYSLYDNERVLTHSSHYRIDNIPRISHLEKEELSISLQQINEYVNCKKMYNMRMEEAPNEPCGSVGTWEEKTTIESSNHVECDIYQNTHGENDPNLENIAIDDFTTSGSNVIHASSMSYVAETYPVNHIKYERGNVDNGDNIVQGEMHYYANKRNVITGQNVSSPDGDSCEGMRMVERENETDSSSSVCDSGICSCGLCKCGFCVLDMHKSVPCIIGPCGSAAGDCDKQGNIPYSNAPSRCSGARTLHKRLHKRGGAKREEKLKRVKKCQGGENIENRKMTLNDRISHFVKEHNDMLRKEGFLSDFINHVNVLKKINLSTINEVNMEIMRFYDIKIVVQFFFYNIYKAIMYNCYSEGFLNPSNLHYSMNNRQTGKKTSSVQKREIGYINSRVKNKIASKINEIKNNKYKLEKYLICEQISCMHLFQDDKIIKESMKKFLKDNNIILKNISTLLTNSTCEENSNNFFPSENTNNKVLRFISNVDDKPFSLCTNGKESICNKENTYYCDKENTYYCDKENTYYCDKENTYYCEKENAYYCEKEKRTYITLFDKENCEKKSKQRVKIFLCNYDVTNEKCNEYNQVKNESFNLFQYIYNIKMMKEHKKMETLFAGKQFNTLFNLFNNVNYSFGRRKKNIIKMSNCLFHTYNLIGIKKITGNGYSFQFKNALNDGYSKVFKKKFLKVLTYEDINFLFNRFFYFIFTYIKSHCCFFSKNDHSYTELGVTHSLETCTCNKAKCCYKIKTIVLLENF
ncbi:conserved Plasmodium protein, unknown function [Plasmodium ovale]|uniref:Uncharacterized protein n=1 Tax=Plasmodium ovale TaxID=36330 RepID=A0A1D3TGQ1_PLAOA|nr:conserved Plasmodium protein, unknown function [Plasmodium ovale]